MSEKIYLLGPPSFVCCDRPVEFSTRKVAALCIYLAANANTMVERKRLSDLLWGNAEEEAARASLRKALSLACANGFTKTLIGRDRANAWFCGDPMLIDLANFHQAIARGTERTYREAMALWRGEPLAGAELGEPAFDDWVREFRAVTTSYVLRYLSERLSELTARGNQPNTEIALCELIVRIEPADLAASERLIRLYASASNTTGAMRRFRAFQTALRDLDLPLPDHISNFAAALRGAGPTAGADVSNTVSDAPNHGIPSVMLQRPDGMRPMPDLFAFAHSEVMCQLTRFGSMRCFEAAPDASRPLGDPSDTRAFVKLDDGLKHDYRLLLWNEPNARSLYLRCVNAHRQQTVSCVRLDYEVMADRTAAERTIATAINNIEQDILNDDSSHPDSAFARWLSAYRHMQSFTPPSDQLAMTILQDLADDPQGTRLSLVHSCIAAIMMKRNLYVASNENDEEMRRADVAISQALTLDEYEPFNHLMKGWLSVQSQDYDRALGAFSNALALNPFSSRTLISAAEANAYCGDVETARKLADRAMELSGQFAPSYFHSYLASIAYLGGDTEECLRRLNRSPENLQTLLLAIAAHEERGETQRVEAARTRLQRELRRQEPERGFDSTGLSRWISRSMTVRDDAVRGRMFSALERAGVAVSQGAG